MGSYARERQECKRRLAYVLGASTRERFGMERNGTLELGTEDIEGCTCPLCERFGPPKLMTPILVVDRASGKPLQLMAPEALVKKLTPAGRTP